MIHLPAFLLPKPDILAPNMSDAALTNTRDYWRLQFDDGTGFAASVDAAGKILECEHEMRRRGMEI